MRVLAQLRRRRCRSVAATIMLAAFAGIGLLAPPCVMGLSVDAGAPAERAAAHDHDCPHCPPAPCAEMVRDDCEAPQSLTPPRAEDPVKLPVLAALPRGLTAVRPASSTARPVRLPTAPPPRPGPRPHLLHAQFNE